MGYGDDVTIRELALAVGETVGETVGYADAITFDTTKPNGTPRKWMDSQRLRDLGWQPTVGLREGLKRAYADFLSYRA